MYWEVAVLLPSIDAVQCLSVHGHKRPECVCVVICGHVCWSSLRVDKGSENQDCFSSSKNMLCVPPEVHPFLRTEVCLKLKLSLFSNMECTLRFGCVLVFIRITVVAEQCWNVGQLTSETQKRKSRVWIDSNIVVFKEALRLSCLVDRHLRRTWQLWDGICFAQLGFAQSQAA